MSFLKFRLLLWKNFLIQKRKPITTFFEIGLPTLFSFILMILRLRVVSTPHPDVTHFSPCDYTKLRPQLRVPFILAYSPKYNLTDRIMERVQTTLNMSKEGFPDEETMVNYITLVNNSDGQNINNSKVYLGGVVFDQALNTDNGTAQLKNKAAFKIRLSYAPRITSDNIGKISFSSDTSWSTDLMFPPYQVVGPRDGESPCGNNPGYEREGFLAIQQAVFNSLMYEYVKGEAQEKYNATGISLIRHPYPPYVEDNYVLVLQQQFPLVVMLSFVVLVLGIVRDIVLEKERRLKESMKMMGINNWLHWVAWFTKHFLFLLISVTIMTIFYTVKLDATKGSVVARTHPAIVFIYLLCFSVATITFCFAVSVFFAKANTAAAVGGILFFCLYIPYFFLQRRYSSLTWMSKVVACLDFQVAMSFGGTLLGMFEGNSRNVDMKCALNCGRIKLEPCPDAHDNSREDHNCPAGRNDSVDTTDVQHGDWKLPDLCGEKQDVSDDKNIHHVTLKESVRSKEVAHDGDSETRTREPNDLCGASGVSSHNVLEMFQGQDKCHIELHNEHKFDDIFPLIKKSCELFEADKTPLLCNQHSLEPEKRVKYTSFVLSSTNSRGHKNHKTPDIRGSQFAGGNCLKTETNNHIVEKPYKCDICNIGFTIKGNLSRHNNKHSGKKPYKCDICNAEFVRFSDIDRHMIKHTGEKPYRCDHCNATCMCVADLKKHLRVHTGEKPYICDVCGKRYSESGHLSTHKRVHTGEKPFQCGDCGIRYNNRGTLKTHMYIHMEVKPYQCDFCGLQLIKKSHFKRHRLIHTGETPYKCDVCDSSFKRNCHLKLHMRHHEKAKLYNLCNTRFVDLTAQTRTHTGHTSYVCDICGTECLDLNNLTKHKRQQHAVGQSYTCNVCGASFPAKYSLAIHQRLHTGEKPYKCEVCGFGFRVRSDLNKHKRLHTRQKYKCDLCNLDCLRIPDLENHMCVHTGQKPHKCDVCSKGFSQEKHLELHRKSHKGRKIYKCNVCDVEYTMVCNLKSHMRIHTGERPYTCAVCGATFMQGTNLNRHMLMHSEARPYKCDSCGAEFKQACSLALHKKTHLRR